MDLTLKRKKYCEDGIFGMISASDGVTWWATLEHAYLMDSGGWFAKIPPGKYTCVKGPHKLHGMQDSFITFEVTGVPGHEGLLFHWGNWDKDSDGCILIGEGLSGDMIVESRKAFGEFMSAQADVSSFQLTVVG